MLFINTLFPYVSIVFRSYSYDIWTMKTYWLSELFIVRFEGHPYYFKENIIINIISLKVLHVNKIKLFWYAYQMTRHIMMVEFSWVYFKTKWILKIFILQNILIKVVQQAKASSCSWLYFFILKDKIKIVDTLVHIIQLLKPDCYCHISHISQFFSVGFLGHPKKQRTMGLRWYIRVFWFQQYWFFSYWHHYVSFTVSSTKPVSRP